MAQDLASSISDVTDLEPEVAELKPVLRRSSADDVTELKPMIRGNYVDDIADDTEPEIRTSSADEELESSSGLRVSCTKSDICELSQPVMHIHVGIQANMDEVWRQGIRKVG